MDRFLLKVCNKDTNRKSLRHSLSIFIANLEYISVQWTCNCSNVILFLNKVGILESSCLLSNGFNLAMKNASKFLCVLPSFGASKILHNKECSLLSATCLADNNILQHSK